MTTDLLQLFGLRLPAGATLAPLASGPAGAFWQSNPLAAAADYADGLEELIADYNQQPPDQLAAWARQHPLTTEQRFILEYNTSADRANVLRTLPLAAGERVLEVGCGCGPVSQYLWSRAQTLSLEASVARARAAAHRLAGHANPHGSALLCADFHQLAGEAGFDWVIFNGVLEYAAIYSGAAETSPYVAMLKKAFQLLKPGGRCVVTIENQLGLKYFSGAPEDHYDRPAVGLEGYRSLGRPAAAIRTFSRPALARLLADAGFGAAVFSFPFPDYKFTKVLVPDDDAAWRFAAERLIEPSPAWRNPREYHFDEPAVFRMLAAEGTAGDFAHSFLVVAAKPGATAPAATAGLHYFPLKRDPSAAVGVTFDLAGGKVHRRLLSQESMPAAPALPVAAPANPRARLGPPGGAGRETVQPLSPAPSLWEELRRRIGATTDAPAAYEQQLGAALRAHFDRYLACLPLAPGSWPAFVAKLSAEFARGGLATEAAGLLRFLETQQAFAEQSLAQLQTGPWCLWAPDWIMENLFPEAPDRLSLFDVEYVDPAACLPAPALVYRQLRVLQARTAAPALRRHWPWPALQLQIGTAAMELPAPAATWVAAALWPRLPAASSDRHAWFWTKVAEIVECAMTVGVVPPFLKIYETAPWIAALSSELTAGAGLPLADCPVARSEGARPLAAAAPAQIDEFIAKEQQILILSQELDKFREMVRIRDDEKMVFLETIAGQQAARQALTAENAALSAQTADLQLQLTERPPGYAAFKEALFAPIGGAYLRWTYRLAARTAHPLGKSAQYPARPVQPERFPRPRRGVAWPRISIITPSYQQAPYLEKTMTSVLDQGYPNLAYGVQDGGSTDGSVEIITRLMPRLMHAESAPDAGQADAIRRGFIKLYPPQDGIMAWLNSDDLLMPGALHYVGEFFSRHPEVDVIYGHRVIIDEQGSETGRWFLPPHSAHTLPWFDLVPQETLFWRTESFARVGGMDPSFHFAMDWDLLLRFEQAGLTIVRVPYFLGCFRVHAQQKTSTHMSAVGEQEMARLRRRTHGREVNPSEILNHLAAEVRRSAVVERLHRLGIRY